MLRKLRIILAVICFAAVTWLFVDFTGLAARWFGWIAKVQFLPAVLAIDVGVIAGVAALTLILGRWYCSVLCPLGVLQDIIARMGRKARRNRYGYSRNRKWLRAGTLVAVVALIIAGLMPVVALVAPYSAYGRIAQSLLQPLWLWGNNALDAVAAHFDSYAFYPVEVWLKGGITLGVAIVTLAVVGVLSWRNGRTWCNTVCPVGTVFGFISKYSLVKIHIDTDKCINCGLCGRNCKSACIDVKKHEIDYSRCVACMDCIDECHSGAISYKYLPRKSKEDKPDTDKRQFMVMGAALAGALAAKAQDKKVDGGLAAVSHKNPHHRSTRIVPPGAVSIRNLENHCTGCQLCVAECPNGVLRPSTGVMTLMQPQMSFERGFCRPKCTRCSHVCPTGAIRPITREEKSATQIGHAVWVKKNCIVVERHVECGNCARHCPTGAIMMVPMDPNNPDSLKIPAVNTEKCTGCGACEYVCPARPFSAIYVEGNEVHREI